MQTSRRILNIQTDNLTPSSIKKAYFKQALIWHPDKNNSLDSPQRFQEIKEAYMYLTMEIDHMVEDKSYNEKETEHNCDELNLSKFINITTGINIEPDVIRNIIEQLKKSGENATINILERLDESNATKMIQFIKKYYFLFGLDYGVVERIDKLINMPVEIITLTPTLENLFNNDIYNLEIIKGSKYYIPLWHDELEFIEKNRTLIVRIEPILPLNIEIDDDNNIHILKTFCINELLGKETYIINIGTREFTIDIQALVIKQHQTVCFEKQGIAKVNSQAIFSIDNTSNIIIHIEIQ